jgi:mono/diheme cytochrome c family protein
MVTRRLLMAVVLGLVGWALVSAKGLSRSAAAQTEYMVAGIVRDESGPVAGATVRIQATVHATQTGDDGTFVLALPGEGPFDLTAWAPGYYCVGPVEAVAGQADVELVLLAHSAVDNPDYEWLPSYQHSAHTGDQGCAQCHSVGDSGLTFTLPVDQWLLDAHARSASNPRFLTMYLGTDMEGNQSPLTRYGVSRDYGQFPLRPELTEAYYGPGYKLDFPATAGNCAACHTPAAAANAPYSTDPTQVSGVEAEGVPCDFCHKVWDVYLNTASGLPYENMPGVLSFEFRRPRGDHQFFAGPYDDVAPGEDTYSPLQNRSEFCAPCHFGMFWGTVVYNSFGEWLESPYSDPESGQTCQDCHMPPLGMAYFARPEVGALERDPSQIFSHRMPGAADEDLLQNTAELALDVVVEGGQVTVTVDVTNTMAGHHIPTDSPLRQIFAVVVAEDGSGSALELLDGPTLPEWAGDLAGTPGVYFAKILREHWTEVEPSGAYWMPTVVVEDTRIPALESSGATYTFAAPASGVVEVSSQLIFRRAFYELMQQKGWQTPDIQMESAVIVVNR